MIVAAKPRGRPPAEEGMDPVQFKAPREWIARAKEEAKRQGIGLSGLIRMAVNQFIERARRERNEP